MVYSPSEFKRTRVVTRLKCQLRYLKPRYFVRPEWTPMNVAIAEPLDVGQRLIDDEQQRFFVRRQTVQPFVTQRDFQVAQFGLGHRARGL